MRVGINAQLLYLSGSYRAAGINKYIRQLLAHLRLMLRDGESAVVFSGRWTLPPDLAPTSRFEWRQTRLPTWKPPSRIAWEQLVQPAATARERLDLLHSPSYVQPLFCPAPSVVTMLDLSFLRMPESFNRGNRVYLSTMARFSARRARRVITISENTRQDVIKLLGVPPERVETIYCGVDSQYRRETPEAVSRFKAENNLPERFLLYLGTLEPRKNVSRLVEAYASARSEHGIPHRLVLAGARGWLYDSIFARVRELGIEDVVLMPGYIRYEELPLWYNAADAFIYPSLYEGFGLPPLEAMACGTPVITSSVSSLPEVVGEAAIKVDPLDVRALADAIGRLAVDETLREQLAAAGPARAAEFSWRDMALQTLQLYRNVASWN